MDSHKIRARDAAVQRLRVVTTALAAAAGAVALVFGVVAAKAFPGRSTHPSTPSPKRVTRPKAAVAKPPKQSAPSLVSAGSQAQPQAPQAPASPAPAPAPAAPVAVSGGS